VAASSDGWRHWELRRQRIVSRGCHSNLAAGEPGGKVSDSSVKQEVGRMKREDRLEFDRPLERFMRNYGWTGRQKRIVMDRSSDNDRGERSDLGMGGIAKDPRRQKV